MNSSALVPLRYAASLKVRQSTETRPLLTLESVESGSGRIIGELEESASEGQIAFEPGDVLFSKLRPYLAKSVHVNQPLHGTGEFLAMVPNDRTDARFLFYSTLSAPWLEHAETMSYGLKMPRTSWEALASLELHLPQVEEQRRIADFLDDQVARMDSLSTAKSRQAAQVEEFRRAALDACASIAKAVQPSRLSRHLRDSCVGVVVNPSDYFVEEGVPFVHGYNVRDGFLDLSDLKRMTRENSDLLSKSRLQANDVLVVRAGFPGRAALVTPDLIGGNCASVLILRTQGHLDPRFLVTFFNSSVGKAQVEARQNGAAQEVVNLGDVRDFAIQVPEMDVQRGALDQLDEQDTHARETMRRLETSVVQLNEYKRSLITAAVTGELDVTTARQGVPA